MPSYINRFEIAQEVKALTGKVDIGAVSIAATSKVLTTVTVQGAAVGDYVIATPTVNFDSTSGITGYFAFVSNKDTVTIKYFNPSAYSSEVSATTFNIMVIKNGVSL